jgi:hypothetical protein
LWSRQMPSGERLLRHRHRSSALWASPARMSWNFPRSIVEPAESGLNAARYSTDTSRGARREAHSHRSRRLRVDQRLHVRVARRSSGHDGTTV